MHAQHLPADRRGFTLTELLVVIAIIAILVSITSVAVMSALATSRQTAIKTELDQLDAALQEYKNKYGSYPPCDLAIDMSGLSSAERTAKLNRIKQHVARAFPRYNLSNLETDLQNYVDTHNFRPDQALVFWLGGFNPDPLRPFENLNDLNALPRKQRTAPLMGFDPARLVPYESIPSASPPPALGAGKLRCPSYIPQNTKQGLPFLYFDATTYANIFNSGTSAYVARNALTDGPLTFNAQTILNKPEIGIAVVYYNDVNANQIVDPVGVDDWVNPEGFQLIAAGLDDKYGTITTATPMPVRLFPAGIGYDTSNALADDDNVTNFCPRARLGDMRP